MPSMTTDSATRQDSSPPTSSLPRMRWQSRISFPRTTEREVSRPDRPGIGHVASPDTKRGRVPQQDR
jgi:hypothetical protein